MGMIDQFNRLVADLKNRVYVMIGRAVLSSTDDSKSLQVLTCDLFSGENRDDVERLQNFGFTSHAPAGSQCLVVYPGGNRDRAVVVVADNAEKRITDLAEGDSAVYNASGVIIKATGEGIELEAVGSGAISIKTPGSGNVSIETGGGDATIDTGGGKATIDASEFNVNGGNLKVT